MQCDVSSLKFIREIGKGCNGQVWLVELQGLYCIAKTPFHPEHTSPSSLERSRRHFEREMSVLAQLHHPNIVQYLGTHCFTDQAGTLTLVMEYLPVDLENVLRACQGCFPLSLRLSILLDISLGMQYLHSRDIVHCDLTPDNILLSSALRAKIADFGCSKPLGGKDSTGYSNAAHSFLTYMPPEVLEPNFIYSEKLDIFTYGVLTLYICGHTDTSSLFVCD